MTKTKLFPLNSLCGSDSLAQIVKTLAKPGLVNFFKQMAYFKPMGVILKNKTKTDMIIFCTVSHPGLRTFKIHFGINESGECSNFLSELNASYA